MSRPPGLHLCNPAVHEQLRSRDVAAVVGRQKDNGLRDLSGCSEPGDRNSAETTFARCCPVSEEANSSLSPGVSMSPGLTAFTRMRRSFKSVVHVRANERTAAFVAL